MIGFNNTMIVFKLNESKKLLILFKSEQLISIYITQIFVIKYIILKIYVTSYNEMK